jgi:hypothetical protein
MPSGSVKSALLSGPVSDGGLEGGGSIFEHDKPSFVFGQFDNEQCSAVARGLDVELERALRRAAE